VLPLLAIGVLLYAGVHVVSTSGPGAADVAAAPPSTNPAPAHGGSSVTIAWVGDIMFGRDGYTVPDGGRALFTHVRSWLRSADITLGNLEGVLTTTGTSKCAGSDSSSCFAFRASPDDAGALRWAGFDAVNVANNHSLDYGPAARSQSIRALNRHNVKSAGQPGEITLLRREAITVALVGLAPYPWAQNSLDLRGAARLVAQAKAKADIVIAMIHAGAEGSDKTHTPRGREIAFGEDRGDTRRIAHTLVDAGARVVLGSGPHVVRGIQRYHGALIAYSLGNFANFHNFAASPVSDQTGVLQLTLDSDGRVRSGQWRSARLTPPGVPVPSSNISAQLARRLSVADFGRSAWPMTRAGKLFGAGHR
jgi:Bacterial capsule synthesis protein PGA_cap